MKYITKVDKKGFKKVYRVRDTDPENADYGIPVGPPDLFLLNWEEIVKEINNRLVDEGLLTVEDVLKSQNGLTNIVLSVVRNKILYLYKDREGDK